MAARSAGGSTRASEPEGSAYTLTFRADDGAGVPSGLGETEVEVDFGEQHDRVPHVSDDGIDEAWRRQLLSAPRTWDAPKFRLASVLVTSTAGGTTAGGAERLDRRDGRAAPAVLLRVGSTSYREHVGTCTSSRDAAARRALREDGLATFGSASAHLSDALGVEAALETSDGGLVLLRRAAGVVGSVGKFNGPSGHPEPELVKTVSRRAAPEDKRFRRPRIARSRRGGSETFGPRPSGAILRERLRERAMIWCAKSSSLRSYARSRRRRACRPPRCRRRGWWARCETGSGNPTCCSASPPLLPRAKKARRFRRRAARARRVGVGRRRRRLRDAARGRGRARRRAPRPSTSASRGCSGRGARTRWRPRRARRRSACRRNERLRMIATHKVC